MTHPLRLASLVALSLAACQPNPIGPDGDAGPRSDAASVASCVVAGRTGTTECATSISGSCPAGQYCDTVMLTCSAGCTSDANCPGDELCARAAGEAVGACAPCERCGDGRCDAGESCAADCPTGPVCGDGACNGTETPSTCPADCTARPVCGDGACNGTETPSTCPADCAPPSVCGDGACNGTETPSTCPADCAPPSVCGDGACAPEESATLCPADCDDSLMTCFGICNDFAFFECIPSAAPCVSACNAATRAARLDFAACVNVTLCETHDACIGLL